MVILQTGVPREPPVLPGQKRIAYDVWKKIVPLITFAPPEGYNPVIP